ncbi:MAG: ABC transporter ATP-binding protein [Candidatus Nanohaloarchaea archaeon]
MKVIDAEELEKSFGDTEALSGISFEADEGEIVGFLGPNGAGKSTTVEILTGQADRDSGSVEVLGMDPGNGVELREKLGILPEREDPPSFLTGDEYLEFVSDIRGEDIERDRWVERFRLEGKMSKLTRDLSKGERQKLMVIQAFFHEPELVFIDEPMINLDPVIQQEVRQLFQEHEGTVFLCTHNADLAEEVCDTVFFLRDGEIIEKLDDTENLEQKFLEHYDY